MFSRILTILALLLSVMSSAQAGTLFPPEGTGGSACPAGQLLRWTGDGVECHNPSDGVTIASCGLGLVMNGIVNGVPSCVSAPLPSHSCVAKDPSYSCPINTRSVTINHSHLIIQAWGDALDCKGPDDPDGGYSGRGGEISGDCRIQTMGGKRYAATHDAAVEVCCTTY